MLRQFSIKIQRGVFHSRSSADPNKKPENNVCGLGEWCETGGELEEYAQRVSADASASDVSVYPRHPVLFSDLSPNRNLLDMPALLARTAKFAPLNNGDYSDSDEGSIQNSPVVDNGLFMTGPVTGSTPPEFASWGPEHDSSRLSSVPSSVNTNRNPEDSPLSSTEALHATSSLHFNEPAKPYSMFLRRGPSEADDHLGELGGNKSRQTSRRSTPPKLRALDGDDEDILPFDKTTQMAARGVRQGSTDILPSVSQSMTMSMEKYQNYRKSLSSLEMLQREDSLIERTKPRSGEDGEAESEDETDGLIASDEKERKREIARRRQQQDAQLSVYRQQMTKVVGNGPPGIPSSSTGGGHLEHTMTFDTLDDDDDDLDDVPLAALRSLTMPQRRGMPRARSTVSIASEFGNDPGAVAGSSQSVYGGVRGGHARRKSQDELPPLPRVFGGEERRQSRGLVAAIAKEEDAKARRKSLPVLAAGGLGGGDTDVAIADLQQQLQHLAEMQFQLYSQLNGGAGPPPPVPYGVSSQRASTIFGSAHMQPPPSTRPASIRSFNGAPTYGYGQRQSLDLGRAPYSPQSYSSSERPDTGAGMPQTPPSARLSPMSEGRPMNRPSMMRLVTSPDDDDDDDDDDDEAWQKTLQERRALRAEWTRSS